MYVDYLFFVFTDNLPSMNTPPHKPLAQSEEEDEEDAEEGKKWEETIRI